MKTPVLYFTAPGQVEIREESLPELQPGQVRVRTLFSAVSAGSEGLIYRGEFPAGSPRDVNIPALEGEFRYPMRYGYCAVGRVEETGPRVSRDLLDKPVFCFHPHQSRFVTTLDQLYWLPDGLPMRDAVFLPNMETALNLVMDGRPLIGERVAVFGLGIVGLLTIWLLGRFPLAQLAGIDPLERRRRVAAELGAGAVWNPAEPGWVDSALPRKRSSGDAGYDLIYELSGVPAALDLALRLGGFASRVVVGSWYGNRPVELNLGGDFHRNRIRLISSQVSTVAPELAGRWSKQRRFAEAWRQIEALRPSRLISHELPFRDAPAAYRLLDEHPEDALQVVFRHADD